jgi:glycosyltransferase involved in cell wall biosynthesis
MATLTIVLFCYNEEVLLPLALDHYRSRFPKAHILVLDNDSTDSSRQIAQARDCEVRQWTTGTQASIGEMMKLKNNVWKDLSSNWVLIADMDEWAELTEDQLAAEHAAGRTILHFRGVQVVGNSNSALLDDIDLHALDKGYLDIWFNKHICFRRDVISEMNYTPGAHKSYPKGQIVFGKTVYKLKHMNYLGLPWIRAKMLARWDRTHNNRKARCSGHYTNKEELVVQKYEAAVKAAKPWREFP